MANKKLAEKLFSLELDELPQEIAARIFPHGEQYVVGKPMKKKEYEKRLQGLQIELIKLQRWLAETGERAVIVFEGRDAAGKGGTIKRFMEHMNPRQARVVALAKPSDRERGEWYFQRYARHLPTKGEMILFDRSWYNRPGVERVMGFCSEQQVKDFYLEASVFEGLIAREGIHFFKFWLMVSREEQLKRFYDRKNDPLKTWKLSPMDHASIGKWHDYTTAIMDILRFTDSQHAPWTVIDSNDKRRARLAAIQTVLNSFDYDLKDEKNIGEVDLRIVKGGDSHLDTMME